MNNTIDFKDYTFIISFKKRWTGFGTKKDKTIIDKFNCNNKAEEFAKFCFHSFKNVAKVNVMDANGGFVFLYEE